MKQAETETPAAFLRRIEAEVGSILRGGETDAEDPVTLEITAIGKEKVLARLLDEEYNARSREGSWFFSGREWEVI